ncbi:MAG: ATPase [bacterium]
MDENLKQLLEAETQAESLVSQAMAKRDELIETTLEEIKAADARFRARIPELRQEFLDRADERALQAISEVKRHYQEHKDSLMESAAPRRDRAVEAALRILTGLE